MFHSYRNDQLGKVMGIVTCGFLSSDFLFSPVQFKDFCADDGCGTIYSHSSQCQ